MPDEPTYMADYRRSALVDRVTARERRDVEILDSHVDTYARSVIAEQMELLLGQTDWKSHDLMSQTDWNRVRDRILYLMAHLDPDESQQQEAARYLYDDPEWL